MVNYIKQNKASKLLALFIFSFSTISAQNKNIYPAFKKYMSWGLYVSPQIYKKAETTQKQGTLNIENLPMQTWGFGFTKLIHPENKFAFKTGFYIQVTPLYNYNINIKKEDLFGAYTKEDFTHKMNASFYRPIITIPAFVQFKKQMAEKIYFNLETGFQFLIMQKGSFETSLLLTDPEISESREVFGMYGENQGADDFFPYPNFIISPGFYFTLNKMLIQTNFVYQKSLITLYKGEYLFDNLTESPRSRGDYKLSGDYIGLSFNIHVLKKENRTRWQRKQWKKNNPDEENEN